MFIAPTRRGCGWIPFRRITGRILRERADEHYTDAILAKSGLLAPTVEPSPVGRD